jgi:hypothetical protein
MYMAHLVMDGSPAVLMVYGVAVDTSLARPCCVTSNPAFSATLILAAQHMWLAHLAVCLAAREDEWTSTLASLHASQLPSDWSWS